METTITVRTAAQAHILRQLQTASETVRREAAAAARKLNDVAAAVEAGQGFVVDFSTGALTKYNEAFAKREALLEAVRYILDPESNEALEAAAKGDTTVWFTSEER